MGEKFKSSGMYFKGHFMKSAIFDERGKKIYETEGNPKKCIKELLFFTRSGLQVLDLDEILESFDWLDLEETFKRVKDNDKRRS